MLSRTAMGAPICRVSAAVALVVIGSCRVAFAQPASPPSAAATPPSGSDAAAREAILKLLTVETLIGDAVSLSNQQYPEVDSAIKRFINGDMAGAREFLEVAKKKYPKLPPTDLTLAKMQVIVRNGAAARGFLEKVATEHPEDPEAYLTLADVAFSEGRITESDLLFKKADELTQKFTENDKRKNSFVIRVLAGLSAVHERRQQWAEAGELLRKWVQVDPDSASAHQRLGAILYRLQKPAEAIAEFVTAREIDPSSNHPQVWLGQLYAQDGKKDEANKALEQAYAAEPDNEGTARAYAEWLIQQNNLTKAQTVAAAMRKKSPESIIAALLDGIIAKMRGQDAAAEEALMKVLTLDPNNSVATNLMALILSESKEPAKLERALGYAQRNAALFPNNTQINITLAWVLYQMGRLQEANQILGRGIQNPSADAAFLIARIMEAQNQPDKAAAVLKEILAQAGSGVFLYRRDAEALLKKLTDAGIIPAAQGEPGAAAQPTGAVPTSPTGASPTGASPSGATPTGAAPTGGSPARRPTTPAAGQ